MCSSPVPLVRRRNKVYYAHLTYLTGTGKSVLLRRIISDMKIKYSKSADAVAVTAPTGVAACNVGGVTIHSFGGIGLGNENATQLATKIKKQQRAVSRWKSAKVLIIDEGEVFNIYDTRSPLISGGSLDDGWRFV
jgi:PIF1-like helicase